MELRVREVAKLLNVSEQTVYRWARDGSLPVNPSGGVLSAHPVLVAGMARNAEAVLQVRGEAGDRQVKGARKALAHGINGACGQAHCVFVLGA